MKKIMTVLTATRAEYGLLRPIIRALMECKEFDVRVVVTGAHLSPEFGCTYQEIEADGIKIHKKIEMLLSSDTPAAVSKSMALALLGFAEYFEDNRPDALLVLGDRYETLAVCIAAMNAGIPIFHLYGGETTEGAVDEAIRHSITKMASLHFTSTELYRKRVIQLGESPENVVTVGAVGIENALHLPLLSKQELAESLSFPLDQPYAVVTFHPVTLEDGTAGEQCRELLKALEQHGELQYLFTKANADADGRVINAMLEEYVLSHKGQAALYESLGSVRYLSALNYASMVIGNSSSGLVEAPSFHIPTVNIGDRQRGRIQAESVINCRPICQEISQAVEKALSEDFRNVAALAENPYGNGDTTGKIVNILKEKFGNGTINLKKKFYEIAF